MSGLFYLMAQFSGILLFSLCIFFMTVLLLCGITDWRGYLINIGCIWPLLGVSDHAVDASSGAASLLLPRGRTAHSRLRIPVEIDERTM
jgi:hypothetical protein